MKFALAVAILGQSLPALSNSNGRSLVTASEVGIGDLASRLSLRHLRDGRKIRRATRRMMRPSERILQNSPSALETVVPCDPTSSNPDTGILSCDNDYLCTPFSLSPLGGICTPAFFSSQRQGETNPDGLDFVLQNGPLVNSQTAGKQSTMVECNPSSIDIGILSCGEEGQVCMQDDASGLGGFCVDTFVYSRRLATIDYFTYMCGTWPDYLPPGYCDCNNLNLTTGSGDMVCSQNITSTYVTGCEDYVVYDVFSYTFEDAVLVKLHDCYKTKQPFMEEICFTVYPNISDVDCQATWNGQSCISCLDTSYFYDFDCSNVDGRVGNSRRDMFSSFDLCANSTCLNLCGEGLYIPDVNFAVNLTMPGYTNYTCGFLDYLAGNGQIADEYCSMALEAAKNDCCERRNSTISGNSSLPEPEPETEPDENSTLSGDSTAEDGDSSTPEPEPGDNATIPGNDNDIEDNQGSGAGAMSTGLTVRNVVFVACQAAIFMALVTGV